MSKFEISDGHAVLTVEPNDEIAEGTFEVTASDSGGFISVWFNRSSIEQIRDALTQMLLDEVKP